ncbi:MAG: phosphatidylserine/phosphatidylglycerophosphate/cardiolipin synthase family protein [Ferruginibacter sp.]
MKKLVIISITLLLSFLLSGSFAQSSRIKCYFNYPVNTVISSGVNAAYLDDTFPDTVAAYINRAKFSIDIVLYNYTSGSNSKVAKLANAINAAVNRGVVVRWIHDGTSSTSNTGLSLLSPAVKRLASPNYSNYIMHNKFMVIDANAPDSNDAVAMTGSYNWSDQQTSSDINNIVFINSRQVALAFYNEFNKMWGGSGSEPDINNSRFSVYKTASAQTRFNVEGTDVEVYFSPKDSLGTRLQRAISTADYDLFFAIYTLTSNDVASLILQKYNSGVYTKGIIDKFSTLFNAYKLLDTALGSNMLIKGSNTLYHNKVLLADALHPESDPLVVTGSFNWSLQAQNSNDENFVIIHDAAVANQYYQSLCQNFTMLGGEACTAPPCAGTNNIIVATARASNYQWQVDTGNGFENITDTVFYSGINRSSLTLINVPTSWYGYRYRCVADESIAGNTTVLKFTAYWNGSKSADWNDASNWNCSLVPDANTDVIISKGVQYFPTINVSTKCRSIKLNKDARAVLPAGVTLELTGN